MWRKAKNQYKALGFINSAETNKRYVKTIEMQPLGDAENTGETIAFNHKPTCKIYTQWFFKK